MDNMNTTPPGSSPQSPVQSESVHSMPEKNTNIGPIIGGVAVALIIIFGGAYYMLNATPVEPAAMPTLQDAEASDDPTVQATMTQSSSDELADIQADLESTDLSSVDEAAAGMDAGQ